MQERRWLLLALYGFLLATAVSGALKATRPKFKIATTSTTTKEPEAEESDDEEIEVTTVSSEANGTTGHTLTGIPQIDYIWDPNLPRELNGYNLSEYPFYNSIPEDIVFKCDGLHDGFYASVPHKCQVYHHCLYGTRYDFLCANFTAFDQKTFICQFVSEVDCVNSKKYWHRNDALYKAATTTTTSTTTTPAPATALPTRSPSRDRDGPRRRRPFRRRPAYDYYDEDYYDDDFDRTRSRGYDRRDDYDYEDRKYRRDRDRDRDFRERDRDYRDRDTRDRDSPRMRDSERPLRDDREKDREMTPRERFPVRSNRRDTLRGGKDPAEEDTVPRTKEQDSGSRSKEVDDADVDDRKTVESRGRDSDDRRYADKRYKDEYDDRDSTALAPAASTEGLVKPAAPSTSLYSRPRTPPKIRRPVPLSEQDKYAYKATSTQTSAEEPRRRPADLVEDDYYEDDLEEVRPRRPMRRRPAYRERDRDFYDSRETRDRDRDRPFRSRYQDEDDDIRLRKHPERSRDRFYERDRERDRGIDRGRDRSLDRGKDRTLDRSLDRERDRAGGRSQDADKPDRLQILARPLDRERENDRSRSSSRAKDSLDTSEPTRRPSIYDRTTEKPSTSTTVTSTTVSQAQEPKAEEDPIVRAEKPSRPSQRLDSQNLNSGRSTLEQQNIPSSQDHPDKSSGSLQHSDTQVSEGQETPENQDSTADEYPLEYYDELEDTPVSSPRTTVRIVKRPFLPSRGGNPNPRGLLPVGSRATGSGRRNEDRSVSRVGPIERPKPDNEYPEEGEEAEEEEEEVEDEVQEEEEEMELSEPNQELKRKSVEAKTPYDAYKAIQTDFLQKQRPDEPDTTVAKPMVVRRPFDRTSGEDLSRPTAEIISDSTRGVNRRPSSTEEGPQQEKSISEDLREQQRTAEDVPTSSGSPNRGKVRYPATEVNLYSSTYKNDDILNQPTGPENLKAKQRLNEVTHRLQDIPESEYDVTLNDALTPTLNQESSLPSGFVLPLHRQLGRDAVLQSSENNYQFSRPLNNHQEEKPFIPSPQFIPLAINERPRTVYYRTPETIHISGSQYRQQRGPWHDYTGY